MAGSKSTSTVEGSSTCPRSSSNSFEDCDSLFTTTNPQQKSQDFGFEFDGLFGSACYTPKSEATTTTSSSFNFDMFRDFSAPAKSSTSSSFNFNMFRDFGALVKSSSSLSAPPPPVYDKLVYDDDIFYGVPGLKSSVANVNCEDVFTSVAASSPPKWSCSGIGSGSNAFDDLLGGFGNVDCSYNLSPKSFAPRSRSVIKNPDLSSS